MVEFGLTGGIGSGKSSVSQRLVQHGAGLVDADATVRRLQAAGNPVFQAIVEEFGSEIVGDDGELNRPALAAIVFNDADRLATLNKLVHPAVRKDMAHQREALAETHNVVVLDIPLLVEGEPIDLAGIVVVDTPVELAIERLVTHRGFSEDDARARMANQVSRDERLAKADFVVDNSGSLDDLDREVARCWHWMQSRMASLDEEE